MRSLALLLLGLSLGAGALALTWSGSAGDESGAPADDPDALRIASLSPALTRTLQMLELEGHLVGRSTYCTSVDPAIPAVGDLLAIDFERLATIAPTHVIAQAPATGLDPALVRLAEERNWTLVEYANLNRLEDIEAMLVDLAQRLGPAHAPALEARARALVASMHRALEPKASNLGGRVLLVHDPEGIGAFGSGTYLHEILEALGPSNALSTEGWVTLGLEDVVRLAPTAIVVVRSGPGFEAGVQDSDGAVAGPLAELGVPIAVLSHPDAYYPAPTVAALAEALDRTLRILAE